MIITLLSVNTSLLIDYLHFYSVITWLGSKDRVWNQIEILNEFEQEMLKQVHEIKNDLREKGWVEGNSLEVSQTSFLRSEDSDAELGFKFE